MNRMPLPPRRLKDRAVPPVIWELPASPGEGWSVLMENLVHLRATWFLLPAETPPPEIQAIGRMLGQLGDEAKLIVAVEAQQLLPRRSRAAEERLQHLGRRGCEGVLVQGGAAEDVKAGGLLHRLARLREQGLIELALIEAKDHPETEWMVHHTPAHAVCLPFGLEDQTAKYRLIEDAGAMGTGLIARRPATAAWPVKRPIDVTTDLSFIAAEDGITSILQPLPTDAMQLAQMIHALTHPMPDADRQAWWEDFAQAVPPPPPLPRGLPVE
jgi:hypothetical protein